jgi:hypothetical protein
MCVCARARVCVSRCAFLYCAEVALAGGLEGMSRGVSSLIEAAYPAGLRCEISFRIPGPITREVYELRMRQASQALRLVLSDYVMWQKVDIKTWVECWLSLSACLHPSLSSPPLSHTYSGSLPPFRTLSLSLPFALSLTHTLTHTHTQGAGAWIRNC